MRTTIRIDDKLLREAKRLAAEQGASLTRVIEDALREHLTSHPASSQAMVALPTFGTRGVRLGVNLDRSADLLRRMDISSG